MTAVDVSGTALDRAADYARQAGVGNAIQWERHDLATSFPGGAFDLVPACYLHSPVALPRAGILRAAAAAVAPSGALLIVGHAGAPSWAQDPPDIHFPTPEEVLADLALPPEEWTVERSAEVGHPLTAPDGTPGSRPDNVLRLRHG